MEKNLKAVLSDKIYMSYTKELHNKVISELTYKVQGRMPTSKPEVIRNYSINKKFITIPIGRKDLIPTNYKIIDKRTTVETFFPEIVDAFIKKLRPSQLDCYHKVNENYLINAKPGWGKTFTAIAISTKLLQKTLIVTHTVGIRQQWETEIKATLGFEPGIIGSGKFNTNASIVVSNIQSLTKVVDKIRHEFGTIIVDECHHIPANTFINVLGKCTAKYKIGLSGTLQRKDGKHILIFDFISQKVFIPPKENVVDPIILIYKSDIRMPGNHLVPWANRVNSLTSNPRYKNIVLNFAKTQAERGHKVLVVSDRIDFLHTMSEECDNSVCVTSKVEKRSELEDMIRRGEKDILFGGIAIYKEGISINEISCLILATAVSNEYLMIQLIGRIIRKKDNKLRPEVIDIVLDGDVGKRQLAVRTRAYRIENYEVRYLN